MTSRSLAGERVLVVEDDEPYRRYLTAVLEAEDAEVRAVADGEEALENVGDFDPTLVVTDLRMPRLDGRELCRRLRQDPLRRQLPILVLSAVDEAAEVGELATMGLVWYLRKGANTEILRKELQNLAGAGHRVTTATGRWLLPTAAPPA